MNGISILVRFFSVLFESLGWILYIKQPQVMHKISLKSAAELENYSIVLNECPLLAESPHTLWTAFHCLWLQSILREEGYYGEIALGQQHRLNFHSK